MTPLSNTASTSTTSPTASQKRIDIYDTTLRDGTQGEGVSLSVQDKLLISHKLDDLGVDFIEGGYPLSNPKDAAFFQEAKSLNLTHAKLVAFGMTRRKGIKAAEDTADGVTLVIILGNPPGFPQLRKALKGKVLSPASLKMADGAPAVTITVAPGYSHE